MNHLRHDVDQNPSYVRLKPWKHKIFFIYFHFNVIFILFNFRLENGFIYTKNKKGKEINNITGCNVFEDVAPDRPRAKRWYFKSQHQDLHQSVNDLTNTESAPEVTPVFTPQKSKRVVFDSSSSSEFCGVCKVRYQSEEDTESDSPWLNCSEGRDWWVHSRCVGIH